MEIKQNPPKWPTGQGRNTTKIKKKKFEYTLDEWKQIQNLLRVLAKAKNF